MDLKTIKIILMMVPAADTLEQVSHCLLVQIGVELLSSE